ncbi:MAG: PilZ domain-containing protein [Magnetococcales bacterium]|nr:PilZ domain-containing protein [Magnetococcales bacterium]
MDLHPIETEEELANELFQLIERAKLGGLISENIEAIDSIVNHINLKSSPIELPEAILNEDREANSSEELRDSYRMDINQEAVAIFDGQRLNMDITDVSTSGFGLISEEEVPHGKNIYLEINGLDGMDIYACKICYCRVKKGVYHVGLRTQKKLPRL